MGICMTCGVVFNDEDARDGLRHECNPVDIPARGKIKRLSMVEEDL